jgi:hypothetical protein
MRGLVFSEAGESGGFGGGFVLLAHFVLFSAMFCFQKVGSRKKVRIFLGDSLVVSCEGSTFALAFAKERGAVQERARAYKSDL